MILLRYASLLFLVIFLASCDEQADEQETVSLQTESYEKFQELDYYDSLEGNEDRIQPYSKNPRYWQYKGEPILLLGASDEDNLFNHPDIWPYGLESHLDLMVHNGGNYVRNTMSSRDHGNVWQFGKNEEGLYNLDTWNEEYWNRFENFLELTQEHDIIVQIELWDRFDYAREPWSRNPFNPKNNVNYTSEESGLPEVIKSSAVEGENPFFDTPPDLADNQLLREYQRALVDKILSISLEYSNVLYCISNETDESPSWSDYWAYFILQQAKERNVLVYVTEMWGSSNILNPMHDRTYKKPDLYGYVDVSQVNHRWGQGHWDNAQEARIQKLADKPRPMNSVKIYGGTELGRSFEEGTKRFWRNIFGGFASSRFHRTGLYNQYGIGLSSTAQDQLRSLRMLTDKMQIFSSEPANHLLSYREQDEAYVMADIGNQYAVYFPAGGSVTLDISDTSGELAMRWLDILNSEWNSEITVQGGRTIQLTAPGDGPWAVLLLKN